MQLLDPQHPFFKPLWRRILTVIAPAAWAMVELSNGATGWAVLFAAAAAYAAYQLFIVFDPKAESDSEAPNKPDDAD